VSVSGDDESYSHRGAREGEIGEFGKRSLCSGFRLFYQARDTRTVGVRWVARYILATSYLKLDDCSRVGGRESVMTVTAQQPAPLRTRVFWLKEVITTHSTTKGGEWRANPTSSSSDPFRSAMESDCQLEGT